MVRRSSARLDAFDRLYLDIERKNTPRDMRRTQDEGFIAGLMTTTGPKTYYYAERVEMKDGDSTPVFLAARLRPSWSTQRAPKSASDFHQFAQGNPPERLIGVDAEWIWGLLQFEDLASSQDMSTRIMRVLQTRGGDWVTAQRKVSTNGHLRSQYTEFKERARSFSTRSD